MVFYPEEQNGKADHGIRKNGCTIWQQFKTASKVRDSAGWYVVLTTPIGKDHTGKRIFDNSYTRGDADEYIIVIPPEAAHGIDGEVHIWIFPQQVLIDHGIVGDNDIKARFAGFVVHMPDDLQKSRGGVSCKGDNAEHVWTKTYHKMYKVT